MACQLVDIFVGTPVNDSRVTIDSNQTIAQVLENAKIAVNGIVYLNGNVINPSQMNKTLAELGVASNDTLHVVKKMDSAI